MIKLMVASDIHGSAYYCKKMLEAFDREQADRLDGTQIVGRRENQFETEVLVRNARVLQEQTDLVVDRASLEDILLFTVKNGREER